VPLDDFYACITRATARGYTLTIGGDVSEPGLYGFENAAIVPTFDIPSEYIDQDAREFRFDNRTTGDDHGIHLLAATKDDPHLLGHFSDNELPFKPDALDKYLTLPDGDPGRKAAQAWLAARPGGAGAAVTDADREAFYTFVVDRYFRITTQAIRQVDPNHLCLGPRLYGGDLGRPHRVGGGQLEQSHQGRQRDGDGEQEQWKRETFFDASTRGRVS
jgi:hypothetical protein